MSARKAQGITTAPLPFAELAPLPAGVFVEAKGFPVKLGRKKQPIVATDYGPNEYPCLHGQCWRQDLPGRGIYQHCPGCQGHKRLGGRRVECCHE